MEWSPLERLRWAAAAVADSQLPAASHRVLPVIANVVSRRGGTFFHSMATLGGLCGVSERTARDGVAALRDRGWLGVVGHRSRGEDGAWHTVEGPASKGGRGRCSTCYALQFQTEETRRKSAEFRDAKTRKTIAEFALLDGDEEPGTAASETRNDLVDNPEGSGSKPGNTGTPIKERTGEEQVREQDPTSSTASAVGLEAALRAENKVPRRDPGSDHRGWQMDLAYIERRHAPRDVIAAFDVIEAQHGRVPTSSDLLVYLDAQRRAASGT